jgi:hypothetical protein
MGHNKWAQPPARLNNVMEANNPFSNQFGFLCVHIIYQRLATVDSRDSAEHDIV